MKLTNAYKIGSFSSHYFPGTTIKKLHKSMLNLFLPFKNNTNVKLIALLTPFLLSLSVCKNNRKIMEEYGIVDYLELTVSGGWETENLFGVA